MAKEITITLGSKNIINVKDGKMVFTSYDDKLAAIDLDLS